MIQEIVVVSGKGGTGKTSITAAFASLAKDFVICDADVDAADMHLLTAPQIESRNDFMGGSIAEIRAEDCVACGRCHELCRFGAVLVGNDGICSIDPIGCEGCGVCVDLCPEKAIDFPVQKCGEWFISDTRFGKMVHARLGIAEENSGKLVSLVRGRARELAESTNTSMILTDGPPGIGCPVIAAIGGAAVLAMVVEPTLSGIHDMQRLCELATHFRVPGLVCINKYDLNTELSAQIEEYATGRNLRVVGRVPFDRAFVDAMVQAQSVIEYAPDSEAAQAIRSVWQEISSSLKQSDLGIRNLNNVIK